MTVVRSKILHSKANDPGRMKWGGGTTIRLSLGSACSIDPRKVIRYCRDANAEFDEIRTPRVEELPDTCEIDCRGGVGNIAIQRPYR